MSKVIENNSRRVLLITEFFSPSVGGTVTTYENIYSRYPKGTVWVVTDKVFGTRAKEEKDGIHIKRVRFPKYYHSKIKMLLLYLLVLGVVLLEIKRNKIEEIHCEQVLPAGMMGWAVYHLLGIPYFVYAYAEEIGIGKNFPFRKKWLRRIYGAATGIFASSQCTVDLLQNVGVSKDKVKVINLGVSRELLSFSANEKEVRQKYGLKGKKIILTVSRLARRKGHSFVLQALRDMVPLDGNLHYLIVGDGEEKDYLKELVKDYSLENHVTFVGSMKGTLLWEAYSICDLFVMPNVELENGDIEGFGIVFLEAGALRKPCIGGKSGGTLDAIVDGMTGSVVDPRRNDELKNKIQEILKNPGLGKSLGEAAYRRIADLFVWEKVFERMEKFRRERLKDYEEKKNPSSRS